MHLKDFKIETCVFLFLFLALRQAQGDNALLSL